MKTALRCAVAYPPHDGGVTQYRIGLLRWAAIPTLRQLVAGWPPNQCKRWLSSVLRPFQPNPRLRRPSPPNRHVSSPRKKPYSGSWADDAGETCHVLKWALGGKACTITLINRYIGNLMCREDAYEPARHPGGPAADCPERRRNTLSHRRTRLCCYATRPDGV